MPLSRYAGRDAYLYAEHGIVTLRFTYLQVTGSPGVVAHRVRRALDACR